MTADSFGKKRGHSAPARIASSEQFDGSSERSAQWMLPSACIGVVVGVVALLWTVSGDTTTAGAHCRANGAGSESCALAAGDPFITCGWLKCGGMFSRAEESTHERLVREDRVRLIEAKQARERERVERVLKEEQSGENRTVKGNRFE